MAAGVFLLAALAVSFVLAAAGGAMLIGFADLLDNVEDIRRNTERAASSGIHATQRPPTSTSNPTSPQSRPLSQPAASVSRQRSRPQRDTPSYSATDHPWYCNECGGILRAPPDQVDRCPHCGGNPAEIAHTETPSKGVTRSDPDMPNAGQTVPLIKSNSGRFCRACDSRLMMAKSGDQCPSCGATFA